MLTGKTNTLRTHPSLLPLRTVLIAAEKESPAHPPRMDMNELRAMQLIARMQSGYRKALPFIGMQDIPASHGYCENLHEMAGIHAR